MKSPIRLLKIYFVISLIVITQLFISCSSSSSYNPLFENLIGKWQEITRIDELGNHYQGSYDIYVLAPDLSAQKQCAINPFCVPDFNARWFLSSSNNQITILTNSGTIMADITYITRDTLSLRPVNTNMNYIFHKILW